MIKSKSRIKAPGKRNKNKPFNVQTIYSTNHYNFLRNVTQSKQHNHDRKFKINKYKRVLHPLPADSNGFIDLLYVDDRYITPTLKLHPEFAAFIFHIDACAKNLLFYIIMYELNHETGHYSFNVQVRDHFNKYCEELFGTSYKDTTINQAHRSLEEHNITCNVKRGTYFLNPLVAGGKTETLRRNLLNSYTNLLQNKDQKNSFEDIYPIYIKGK
jgi:hypothetical protein